MGVSDDDKPRRPESAASFVGRVLGTSESDKVTILQLRSKLERAEARITNLAHDVKRLMDERDDALRRAGAAETELRRLQQANQTSLLSRLASAEPTAPDARVARLERLVMAIWDDREGDDWALLRSHDDARALQSDLNTQTNKESPDGD